MTTSPLSPPCGPLLISLLALLLAAAPSPAQTLEDLHRQFLNPPDAGRPMVRWWWFGAAVEKPEILRELQQMKADGIGGAELAFVYPEVLDDPAKGVRNLPFLSKEMLEAVTYAGSEGRKLGLRIDVTLCSGWPYGGPDTTLAEAAGRLRTVEFPLPKDATSAPKIKLPEGDSVLLTMVADGEPKHWDATTARPMTSPLPISTNPRVAIFYVASHTRQQVKRAAVGAEGYVLDPFSQQAVATHLEKVGEPLIKAFGDTPPYAIFSDSLEAYGADWTPALPAEFLKRRGYDLLPHLPELVAGGAPSAQKVRHDYGRTLTELVNENYLTQINLWAIAHHTRFRSQTYGEPAVSFSSQRLAGLPEGEGPQWRTFSTLRWASSANHIFRNNVTSGETFTWLHSPVFRATPLDMKAEADIDFIMGENQLIFHGWPYSPPGVPEPGWSLYAAASFNHHNPWHPVLPAVDQYIARISSLLRRGEPANQVAILLPTDDAWAGFSPGKVSVTGAMKDLLPPDLIGAILSAGYNFDFIDAGSLGDLRGHSLIIIPPTDRIPVNVMRELRARFAVGGKIVAVGHLPTLDPEGNLSPELASLNLGARPAWPEFYHYGPFPVFVDATALAAALPSILSPDFKLLDATQPEKDALGFIRRRLPEADIYFVTNTSNLPITATAAFGTPYAAGEQWDTDSSASSQASPAGTLFHLAPYESRIFVFTKTAPAVPSRVARHNHRQNLSTGWHLTFPEINKSVDEPTLTDWTSDPTTKNYSGEAIYTHTVNLPSAPTGPTYLEVTGGTPLLGAPTAEPSHTLLPNGMPDPKVTRTGPGMHAFYDPPIHEAALVVINGKPAGALWHPPYRLDISKLLKPGENTIEIHVYNTALNAWAALPPHDYGPLIEKYGDRFQMQDLDKVQPLPSGILGHVLLVSEEQE